MARKRNDPLIWGIILILLGLIFLLQNVDIDAWGFVARLWPLRPDLRTPIRLRPVITSGGSTPPASRKVGARSIRLTKSSTTRPPGASPQRTARATPVPKS